MESDFTTRQHIDSLTPVSDPNLTEVLNKYKFPPVFPTAQQQPMGNFAAPYYGPPQGSSNNDMLLGSILGQLQANQQNSNPNQNGLSGFQLNINTEVLRWLLLIILLAVLIWLVLKVQKNRKNPLKKRLRKLEKEYKRMRKSRRKKNPQALEMDQEPDLLDDDVDDFDDLDDM